MAPTCCLFWISILGRHDSTLFCADQITVSQLFGCPKCELEADAKHGASKQEPR